jgi:hypothetical protein
VSWHCPIAGLRHLERLGRIAQIGEFFFSWDGATVTEKHQTYFALEVRFVGLYPISNRIPGGTLVLIQR